jgi:hypothetical protein
MSADKVMHEGIQTAFKFSTLLLLLLLLLRRLADKMNTMLLKRMGTLRRDLAHVSELMRDSFSRINDPPPPVSSLVSHSHTRSSSGGGSGIMPASPLAAAGVGEVLLEEREVGEQWVEAPRRTSSHPCPDEPLMPAAADIAAAGASGAPTPQSGASPLPSPRLGHLDGLDKPPKAAAAAAAAAASAATLTVDQVKLNKINKGVLDVLQKALQRSPGQQHPPQQQQFVVGDVQIRALASEVEPVVGSHS